VSRILLIIATIFVFITPPCFANVYIQGLSTNTTEELVNTTYQLSISIPEKERSILEEYLQSMPGVSCAKFLSGSDLVVEYSSEAEYDKKNNVTIHYKISLIFSKLYSTVVFFDTFEHVISSR